MRTKLLFSTLLSALAASSAACGSLDGHTGSPTTLATVQGALTNSGNVPVGNDVRVAVVWMDLNQPGGLSVSEDLPVQPVFPSNFVVQLTQPPPASSMQTYPGTSTEIGVGVVVAYEDLNGDGKLDLVPNDAGAFIDKIVGANSNLYLVYIGGPVPTFQNAVNVIGTPSPGYNIFQSSPCAHPDPQAPDAGGAPQPDDAGITGDGGAVCPPDQWLPITTPYDLPVSNDPQVNEIMCANGPSGGAGGGGGTIWYVDQNGIPPGGFPAAGSPGLTCRGSTGYEYKSCKTTQLLCSSETFCEDDVVELGAASPPSGWPCP
jgi:hypothetical protein